MEAVNQVIVNVKGSKIWEYCNKVNKSLNENENEQFLERFSYEIKTIDFQWMEERGGNT